MCDKMTINEQLGTRYSWGNFRILYDINSEGIEITCPVCGLYSAGSEMANKYGNGVRIPLQILEKEPYVCRCGTKFHTTMGTSHWHLFMEIPESLINKELLKKITEEQK